MLQYPIDSAGRPVSVPAAIADAICMDGDDEQRIVLLKDDAAMRARLNQLLGEQSIDSRVIDALFSVLAGGEEELLTRSAFELRCVEWANDDPENEPDPVVEWDVFRRHAVAKGPL